LVAFSLILPTTPTLSAPVAAKATITAPAPAEVSKQAPPSPLPEPPPPPQEPIDCSKVPCVALTFDDGPSPNSAGLLDQLRALGVKATFFNTGQNVVNHPDQVKRQVDDGHVVAGHSWNHTDMRKQKPGKACDDAARTAEAIRNASGVETILVRPPYGGWNQTVLSACQGMTFILWNVDTLDWSTHDAAKITDHALNDSKPGSIILMHDTVPETVDALPGVVAGLRDLGYALVTVPELWTSPITPGQAIYSGPHP
jgi:peptidoglycan/xylan/chitin deacetylase (PgdA/CDA1 family)